MGRCILRVGLVRVSLAMGGIAASACQSPVEDGTAAAELRAIEIVRAYNSALSDVDYEVFKTSLMEGAVWHYRGRTYGLTAESERTIQQAWKKAFPDHQYRLDMVFAKRDTVVTLLTYTGTHTDTIMGIPPTGRQVSVSEVVIWRIEEDLIAEQWVVFDEHQLRRQLAGN